MTKIERVTRRASDLAAENPAQDIGILGLACGLRSWPPWLPGLGRGLWGLFLPRQVNLRVCLISKLAKGRNLP